MDVHQILDLGVQILDHFVMPLDRGGGHVIAMQKRRSRSADILLHHREHAHDRRIDLTQLTVILGPQLHHGTTVTAHQTVKQAVS